MRTCFCLLILVLIACNSLCRAQSLDTGLQPSAEAQARTDEKKAILKIHQDAFEHPFDEAKLKAYMQTLPRVDDYYIVEGDIPMSEQELRGYVLTKSKAATLRRTDNPQTSELMLVTRDGKPDFLRQINERSLSYVIDKKSFSSQERYEVAARNMDKATKDWMTVCPECQLRFTHLQAYDESISQQPVMDRIRNQISFIVREYPLGGSYVALAFFPHDPPSKRYISIDPKYFLDDIDPDLQVGVLRHELGHVFGYVHENIRSGIAGCGYLDKQWVPLTDYDSNSVMHYPCGGNQNLKLVITDTDKAGHRKLYALPAEPAPMALLIDRNTEAIAISSQAATASRASKYSQVSKNLVIRFEGGDIPENAVKVISALVKLGIVETASHEVEQGDTIQKIYTGLLDFPGYSKALVSLANHLNDTDYNKHKLKLGETISYPKVSFGGYQYSKKYDLSIPEQRTELDNVDKKWGHVILDKDSGRAQSSASSDMVRVILQGYQLELAVDSTAQLEKAIKTLSDLELKNIRWSYSSTKPGGPKYDSARFDASDSHAMTSVQDARQFWNRCIQQREVEVNNQGALASLIGIGEIPACPAKCTGVCPKVVLIDQPLYLHPNIANAVLNKGDAVEGSAIAAPIVKEGKYTFEQGLFDAGSHHGTHLAGIIASQANGFGLIGVNPSARIYSLNWNHYINHRDQLANMVEEYENKGEYPVYLLASEWDNIALREQDRTKDALAATIKSLTPLFITAAGDGGNNITTQYPKSPMNLGDLPSVIVVTACKNCYGETPGQSPQLMDNMNYSSDMVHIAAPGVDIPSTIADGKYATAPGSSQASAFVAGVASIMISCHPDFYRKPWSVKVRLQVTARPFPQEDADKVASGILDAHLALLDPNLNWVRLKGKTEMIAVESIKWATKLLNIVDAQTGNAVSTGNILGNIYRIINQDGTLWIYSRMDDSKSAKNLGKVLRTGPVRSLDDQQAPLFTFETQSGITTLRLKDIEDLLLSTPVRN